VRFALSDEQTEFRDAVRSLLEDTCGPDDIRAAWADPVWKDRLKRANDEALAAGVFGAPFFVVDGEPFWGNDRKPQIERWLSHGPF